MVGCSVGGVIVWAGRVWCGMGGGQVGSLIFYFHF